MTREEFCKQHNLSLESYNEIKSSTNKQEMADKYNLTIQEVQSIKIGII